MFYQSIIFKKLSETLAEMHPELEEKIRLFLFTSNKGLVAYAPSTKLLFGCISYPNLA